MLLAPFRVRWNSADSFAIILQVMFLCVNLLQPIESKNGLLTTVAYQMGPKKKAVYALEVSCACSSVSLLSVFVSLMLVSVSLMFVSLMFVSISLMFVSVSLMFASVSLCFCQYLWFISVNGPGTEWTHGFDAWIWYGNVFGGICPCLYPRQQTVGSSSDWCSLLIFVLASELWCFGITALSHWDLRKGGVSFAGRHRQVWCVPLLSRCGVYHCCLGVDVPLLSRCGCTTAV